MAQIILDPPIEHDGKSYAALDFDPPLGALEDFEDAMAAGKSEMRATIDLVASSANIPREVIRQIRQSQLEAVMAEVKPTGPLPSSTPSSAPTGEDGEPSRPMLHTS